MKLSVVYGREIDGETTTFGTTGYTYKSTFLIYDRKTQSVWYPYDNGEFRAIGGTQAGATLPFLAKPEVITLAAWAADHPDTRVLVGSQ